jgi:hypothetical protein
MFEKGDKVVRIQSEGSWVPLGARGIVHGPDPKSPERIVVTWAFPTASPDGEKFGMGVAQGVSCTATKMVKLCDASAEQVAFVGVLIDPMDEKAEEVAIDEAIERLSRMVGGFKANPQQVN